MMIIMDMQTLQMRGGLLEDAPQSDDQKKHSASPEWFVHPRLEEVVEGVDGRRRRERERLIVWMCRFD